MRNLRPPRGVYSDVLTKSQQLSIIKVTIDIRVLKVCIAWNTCRAALLLKKICLLWYCRFNSLCSNVIYFTNTSANSKTYAIPIQYGRHLWWMLHCWEGRTSLLWYIIYNVKLNCQSHFHAIKVIKVFLIVLNTGYSWVSRGRGLHFPHPRHPLGNWIGLVSIGRVPIDQTPL